MKTSDLLIEIGTEELPPKSLKRLSEAFSENLSLQLQQEKLSFNEIKTYATPRRLAIIVNHLANQQPDGTIERRGPALGAAYDHQGNPTSAALGFAKSCNVMLDQLQKVETNNGSWLCYKQHQAGKPIQSIIASIIRNSLKQLPIHKPMRWNNHDIEFVRPVHWVMLKLGEETISEEILGKISGNQTYGHRFHHPAPITIQDPHEYTNALVNTGYVIADFSQRKAIIQELIRRHLPKNATVLMDDALLDEVTGLVEWPVPLLGKFDERFLQIPQEVLILAMKTHQRYFALIDEQKKLLPNFIAISNIESKNPDRVVKGNERVLQARLADAEFFYQNDLKIPLAKRIESLKTVVFQNKLGSLYDKMQRIVALTQHIGNQLRMNVQNAIRAAELCKADLMTNMVGEFPELQGTMGYYYSLHDGESLEVAKAISEHHKPRFASDNLPETLMSCVISMSDKIDTLIGIIGMNQLPTGTKDPFALRRAAMGVLRILVEKQLNLDLKDLLQNAAAYYYVELPNHNVLNQTLEFMMERLCAWYVERGVNTHIVKAVMACNPTKPFDFDLRIHAVEAFLKLPQAQALTATNKRVMNILTKQDGAQVSNEIQPQLFEHEAERKLAKLLLQKQQEMTFSSNINYTALLTQLSSLQQPIDDFFDNVMVMTDNLVLQHNRLALLYQLRKLFLKVADISLLQQ